MPLSNSQKEFITGAIGHLIDFPNTREGLIACVKQITTCIKQNNLSLAGDYKELCSCIIDPTDTLRRLENYNENNVKVTVGEVKNHLLALITQQLEKNCGPLSLTFGDIGWQPEIIANTFTSNSDFASEFVSKRSRTEDQLPRWENIRFENSMFQAALFRNENSDTIRFEVRLTLPHETRCETVEHFAQTPQEAYDEEAVMHAFIPAASKEATNRAIDFLKTYLTRRQSFTSEKITKLTEHSTIKPLLLDSFYILLLLRNPQLVDLFLRLTPPQVNILRQSFAKSVLANQLCTMEEILQYTPIELQLIILYSLEIKSKLIPIEKFKKLTDVQTRTLAIPAVSNAIKSQKLPLEKALQFPIHAHAIFTSPLYADFFVNTTIDLNVFVFMKSHHSTFFLKPEIAALFKDKALSFNYALHFTSNHCTIFSNPQIIALLAKNILRSGHLLRADDYTIDALMTNTHIYEALLLKVISIHDVLTNAELQKDRVVSLCDINDIYTKIFVNRINSILKFQSLQSTKVAGDTSGMVNEGHDCVTAVLMDYLSAMMLKHIDNQLIHHRLLIEFVTVMQLKLAELTLENAKTNQLTHQRDLLKALHNSYHPGHNAYQRAIGLLTTAKDILTRLEMPPPSGPTLFSPTTRANTDHIKKLCKLVTEFESLIRIEEELTLEDDQTKAVQPSGVVIHI